MSQPEPNQVPSAVTQSLTPPVSQPRSCLRQIAGFIGWLFTLIMAVALTLTVAGGFLYWVGVDLTTPQQIRQASTGMQTLQMVATDQAVKIHQLQTTQAQLVGELGSARERIDELEVQASELAVVATTQASYAATAVALGRSLQTAVAENGALQDQFREGQVLVAVVATVQATQNERIREVERRSERLIRFLNRLSDIAGDTADDVASPTPTSITPIPPTPTMTAQATPTP